MRNYKRLPLSVSMVIPVYNGEMKIINEISKAQKSLTQLVDDYEILIGDDKSIDKTNVLLSKAFSTQSQIKIFSNETNKGIAQNVKNLYKHAKKKFILFYVADGDWKSDDIQTLLKKTYISNADIVIGNRTKKGGYTVYRNVISFFHNILPFFLFGVYTVDAGSLKVYRRSLINSSLLLSTSVFIDAEIIIRARRKGAKIETVPVTYQKPITSSGVAAKPSVVLASLIDILRLRLRLPFP